MERRGPGRVVALACAAAFVLGAAAAGAHIVYGRPSLMTLSGGAEWIAHVRVVDPAALARLGSGGKSRAVVEAEVREPLKGSGEPGQRIRFASHGHGVAAYAAGDEAIVFLTPIASSRELSALRGAGVEWVSFQEHDTRHLLEPGRRERLLGAVRDYVAAGAIGNPRERVRALRRVTLGLIVSGDEELAVAAVQDAAAAPTALPLLERDDVPLLLERVVSSPAAHTGARLALLSELERRGWVAGAPLWLSLMADAPMPDRLQVIRAAGRHPAPEVDAALAGLLGAGDSRLAEAAALALASPAHAGAVPPLAGALAHPESRVRRAAVRALGAIGTPEALGALERAARSHEDGDLQRRAAAEVRKRAR